MKPNLRITRADYGNPDDAAALVKLLDDYARDPMGGGAALEAEVKARLCADLARNPMAVSFLAWNDTSGHAEAIGLANCFIGYSTFKARPLLNVHDIIVVHGQRGRGVGQALLSAAEAHARSLGCCKLTLEVLTGNARALASYRKFGFAPYSLDPAAGQASFMQKWL